MISWKYYQQGISLPGQVEGGLYLVKEISASGPAEVLEQRYETSTIYPAPKYNKTEEGKQFLKFQLEYQKSFQKSHRSKVKQIDKHTNKQYLKMHSELLLRNNN